MAKGIYVRAPPDIVVQLREVKGEESWLSLLLDGARHRNREIEYSPRTSKYDGYYYCSGCEKWIPQDDAVYNVARAKERCPTCFRALKTGGQKGE